MSGVRSLSPLNQIATEIIESPAQKLEGRSLTLPHYVTPSDLTLHKGVFIIYMREGWGKIGGVPGVTIAFISIHKSRFEIGNFVAKCLMCDNKI